MSIAIGLSDSTNELQTILASVFKIIVDFLKTYTYNKSTVWFLSTPIRYCTMCTHLDDQGGLFFVPWKCVFCRWYKVGLFAALIHIVRIDVLKHYMWKGW